MTQSSRSARWLTCLLLIHGKAERVMVGKLPEYCIWDFNGTLLDDVEAGICAVNDLLSQRGLAQLVSREAYQNVFGFPIQGYYERLGFDFQKESYETLAPLWVERYLYFVRNAQLFEDVRETVAFFNAHGVKQVVLSATERQMLLSQLRELELLNCFEEVLGLNNIHAVSKISLAEDWRQRHPNASVLLIGDTDHDVQTARAMNASCVLIARGHQSVEKLTGLGVPIFPDLRSFCASFQ